MSQPTNNSKKVKDEQMTSDALRQHFKMATGRPIPQDSKEKVKKPK